MPVEGTRSEVDRNASGADVGASGPASLTISLRLTGLETTSIVAEPLRKPLIHRNVPGEWIRGFLQGLDRHWQFNAALASFSPSQRWLGTVRGLASDGWPVLGGRARWRPGKLTVPWLAVEPFGFDWHAR
ncbi:MAG: hypothetical protein LH605_11380 [Microbacteriaceae bacterium]|nr:hypothetical protein [Microbacteriaceae bacterium]